MRPIRSILVPTDFSPTAEHAVDHACLLARSLGARITLLHVYQLPDYFVAGGEGYLPQPEAQLNVLDSVRAQLDAEVERIGPRAGRPVGARSIEGKAAEEIVRAAHKGNYDLIVMGTHGRKGIGRVVLGSIAEQVLRRADCPVLTVREVAPARVEAA